MWMFANNIPIFFGEVFCSQFLRVFYMFWTHVFFIVVSTPVASESSGARDWAHPRATKVTTPGPQPAVSQGNSWTPVVCQLCVFKYLCALYFYSIKVFFRVKVFFFFFFWRSVFVSYGLCFFCLSGIRTLPNPRSQRFPPASFFLRPTPEAYGSSQARDQIRVVAAGLCHSHSNVGSEPCLPPMPQLTAMPGP